MILRPKKVSVLQIGKVPPPVGGVTVHQRRLLDELMSSYASDISVTFYDLNNFSISSYIFFIVRADVVHLHSSSPLFRLLSVLLVRVFHRKIAVTVHGNLGRFDFFQNMLDKMAVRFANLPIVLNRSSFKIAKRESKNTVQLSAFLPGHSINDLHVEDVERIQFLKKDGHVFVTNASGFSRDSLGEEIYGILPLVSFFKNLTNSSLIVSDPSGQYEAYFIRNKVSLPENILLLSYPHNFNAVLDFADCFIRNTTTDGDSLSVHEALFKGVGAICSNVVDRPNGAIVYGSFDELCSCVREYGRRKSRVSEQYDQPETAKELVQLYKLLAQGK